MSDNRSEKKVIVCEKVSKVLDLLESLRSEKFTGKLILEFHFNNGGITDAFKDTKRERI